MELKSHIEQLETFCLKIVNSEEFIDEIMKYLSIINIDINLILEYANDVEHHLEINEQFIFQVVKDIVYGIENRDYVYLLDVVKYGLLQIYYYVVDEIGEM